MKTSRLRSNFSRKHVIRTKTHRRRPTRFRRRKTRYIMHGFKRRTMRGGSLFKKINGYNAYDQPIEEVSYSSPMQWDD
jgi:hypothetical protein